MERDEVKRRQKRLVLVGVLLLLFAGLGILVRSVKPAADVAVASSVHFLVFPLLTGVMRFITWTGEPIAAGLTLCLVVLLWVRSRRDLSVLFAVSVGGAALANEGIKRVFKRARPDLFAPLAREIGYSYPSGHTTTAAALYGLAAILLARSGHRVPAALLLVWVLLVGFSRVYLAVHWPSDVLGSLLFSSAWLLVVVGGYDRLAPKPMSPAGGGR